MLKILSAEQKTITAAALLIGASSLLSRLLGVVRERLLVGTFGVGDTLDAYYAAFQIPNFLFNLLILGTLSAAFIPVFTVYLEEKRNEAWRIAASVLNITILVMGGLSVVLYAATPGLVRLVAPGFDGEKLELASDLTRLMLLSPFLFSISAVFGGILTSFRRFLVLSLAPLLYNASIIGGIVFLAPRYGIHGVALGVVVGAGLHALVQIPVAASLGFRFNMALDFTHRGVREIGRLFLPRIFGIDITQISLLVGTIIGSTLAVGSVALFNLATNIEMVALGVFGIPFAVAAFPALSAAAARKSKSDFLQAFSSTARQILFFLLPISAMTVVLRAQVVRLIIGTRQISWDDTRLAAAALALFALTLVFQGLTPLLSRSFYALKNTWTPVAVSGVSMIANVAAAYGFLGWLARDLPAGRKAVEPVTALQGLLRLQGIADIRMLALPLAFSVAALVQAIVLAFILRRKMKHFDGWRIAVAFVKIGASSLFAALATYAGLYVAEGLASDRTFMGLLYQTTVAAAIGIFAFFGISLFLRTEETAVFLSSLRRKLFRLPKPLGITETEEL